MFIRPIGTRVEPARRPTGRPLLRGLLTRAAGAASPSGTGAAARATGGPESAAGRPGAASPRVTSPGGASSGGASPGASQQGLAAELAQLANLAREGLLTPQEFKEAKTRLLHS
ncbi:SHOCT domain-containing protein [Streptomyces vinaceus]|uniref:SHOCT domain-containing protein n=1 Tax=Streptomyces vinaceus TaxID=1960 RepID=UPI003806A772